MSLGTPKNSAIQKLAILIYYYIQQQLIASVVCKALAGSSSGTLVTASEFTGVMTSVLLCMTSVLAYLALSVQSC